MMAEVAAHDGGAGGARVIILDVVRDRVPRPERQGPDPGADVGDCGDHGVGYAHGFGHVADQGPDELPAGAGGGPLDHRSQGAEVVGHRGAVPRLARTGWSPARLLNSPT